MRLCPSTRSQPLLTQSSKICSLANLSTCTSNTRCPSTLPTIRPPRLLQPFKKRTDLSSNRSAETKAAKNTRLCTTNSANTSQEITLSFPPRLQISTKAEQCALPTKSSTPLTKSHLRQQTAACTTSTAKNTWTTPLFAYISRQSKNLTICTPERA